MTDFGSLQAKNLWYFSPPGIFQRAKILVWCNAYIYLKIWVKEAWGLTLLHSAKLPLGFLIHAAYCIRYKMCSLRLWTSDAFFWSSMVPTNKTKLKASNCQVKEHELLGWARENWKSAPEQVWINQLIYNMSQKTISIKSGQEWFSDCPSRSQNSHRFAPFKAIFLGLEFRLKAAGRNSNTILQSWLCGHCSNPI